MSEPKTVATTIEEIIPGVWHWSISDDRIGGYQSDAYAVKQAGGVVMIDPLPLAPDALAGLGKIDAICLTAACHQRASWRYRKAFGVKVYAPADCRAMADTPDISYRAGDKLPGALEPVHTPGPESAHHGFLRHGEPTIFFCADLLVHGKEDGLRVIAGPMHDDPETSLKSVHGFLDLDFDVLCLSHGEPIFEDPKTAIEAALENFESRQT